MQLKKSYAIQKAIKIFKKRHGFMKASEALHNGIQPRTLYAMRDQKIIEELTRGLFRLSDISTSAYHDLVVIAQKLPKGIICLLSALNFHNITSQIPHDIYIAYQQGWHQPQIKYPPVKIFRFSKFSFNAGIEKYIIDGISVKIYSPEKTIADCFKFRNKIGLDVAIEALKFYWKKNKNPNIQLLMQYARICRISKVIHPYLEALVHE